MATYATLADLTAYIDSLVIDDPARTDALIMRAERDVDSYLGGPIPDGGGLKHDPATLPAGQREALKRATCAQTYYRILQGEDFFTRDQPTYMQGPDFTMRGQLARFSPLAEEELAGSGLSRQWRTVTPPA